jgi:hypothetical protein
LAYPVRAGFTTTYRPACTFMRSADSPPRSGRCATWAVGRQPCQGRPVMEGEAQLIMRCPACGKRYTFSGNGLVEAGGEGDPPPD